MHKTICGERGEEVTAKEGLWLAWFFLTGTAPAEVYFLNVSNIVLNLQIKYKTKNKLF